MSRKLSGSRAGAGPAGEPGRGEVAARVTVAFFCALGHRTCCAFAVGVALPERWECHCGRPAGRDPDIPPPTSGAAGPYKSHLQYLQQRRTSAEGAALLQQALDRRQAQRRTATRSAAVPRLPAGTPGRRGSGAAAAVGDVGGGAGAGDVPV